MKIQAPRDQLAHPYRDRKGHYSINTQVHKKYKIPCMRELEFKQEHSETATYIGGMATQKLKSKF